MKLILKIAFLRVKLMKSTKNRGATAPLPLRLLRPCAYLEIVKLALNKEKNRIWVDRWVKNGPQKSDIICGWPLTEGNDFSGNRAFKLFFFDRALVIMPLYLVSRFKLYSVYCSELGLF